MRAPIRTLTAASLAYAVSAAAGTVVALTRDLPAEFGGFIHGEATLQNFLGINGTALSAPFPALLLQGVLTLCAWRGGHVGQVGVVGLTLLGAVFTAGQLGEPIVSRAFAPSTFQLLPALAVVANLACSLTLFLVGVAAWRKRAWESARNPSQATRLASRQ